MYKSKDGMSKWEESLTLNFPRDIEMTTLRDKALECNQITWSSDDSKILGGYSHGIISVWDAHTGQVIHLLERHEECAVHVLQCHHEYPALLLSAGYDGICVLWDINTGSLVKE